MEISEKRLAEAAGLTVCPVDTVAAGVGSGSGRPNRRTAAKTAHPMAASAGDPVPDEVKGADIPRKWTDVLAPKWKGRIVLSDPRAADNYMGWLDAIERAHGGDYLKKLAALDFKLTPSGASGVQLVAAGAMAMNFPTISTFVAPLVEKKAPIAVIYPEGPSLASGREVGIVINAPHPNAARLFVNWTLSDEGVRAYCGFAEIPVVGDPQGKLGCVPSHNVEQVDFEVKEDRAHTLTRALGLGQ